MEVLRKLNVRFIRFLPENTHVEKMSKKTHRIDVPASESLEQRLSTYADSNGISMAGAVRMILNQELPAYGDDKQ